MSPQDWGLSSVVAQVLSFREERDWAQFHRPKELAAGLAIEAAELQELFLWRDGETAADVSRDAEELSLKRRWRVVGRVAGQRVCRTGKRG